MQRISILNFITTIGFFGCTTLVAEKTGQNKINCTVEHHLKNHPIGFKAQLDSLFEGSAEEFTSKYGSPFNVLQFVQDHKQLKFVPVISAADFPNYDNQAWFEFHLKHSDPTESPYSDMVNAAITDKMIINFKEVNYLKQFGFKPEIISWLALPDFELSNFSNQDDLFELVHPFLNSITGLIEKPRISSPTIKLHSAEHVYLNFSAYTSYESREMNYIEINFQADAALDISKKQITCQSMLNASIFILEHNTEDGEHDPVNFDDWFNCTFNIAPEDVIDLVIFGDQLVSYVLHNDMLKQSFSKTFFM